MTVIGVERRLWKVEAARLQSDPAFRVRSDEELAEYLRRISNDPIDRTFAGWFMDSDDAPLPDGALEILKRVTR